MAVHDGAATELLLDNDPTRFRAWLADLLIALLDHPTKTPQPATAHPAAPQTVRPSQGRA